MAKKFNLKNKSLWKKIGIGAVAGVLGLGAVMGVGALLEKQEEVTTKNIHLSYEVGGLTEDGKYLETKEKQYWWQLIQLLPSSYNQKRTVQLNYEVLNHMYHSRKHHKLDEWKNFCKLLKNMPYSEFITGEFDE